MSTPAIENIIVVMLENRSYDNLLGGLYLNTNGAPYNTPPTGQTNLNGLANSSGDPGNYSNPYAASSSSSLTSEQPISIGNQTAPTQVGGAGTYYPPTAVPVVDPGEQFSDMAYQIMGSAQSSNPYGGTWPPSSATDLMQGFTGDYASLSGYAVSPQQSNIPDVMNYFTPAQVPVTAWLANNFAVCDQWFASAPCQTFTNRVFAHCAAPGIYNDGSNSFSLVDDAQYVDSLVNLPSIFSMLDEAYPNNGLPNWKVYFHDYSISMLTVPYVKQQALSPQNVNVATFDNTDWGTGTPQPITELTTLDLTIAQTPLGGAVPSTFFEDLQKGTLPMYSFIEPRYSNGIVYGTNPPQQFTINSYPPNSNHPGGANYPAIPDPLAVKATPVNPVGTSNPPIDVADGEAFLKTLYNALQQSSYWKKTLLIITYDEHGGCFDHVTPPSATSPGRTTTNSITIPEAQGKVLTKDVDPTADTFNFNVLGGRVPAIIVSPYIKPGSQISGSTAFDHTSIIATVWDFFITNGNPPNPPAVSSLTSRDAAAPSLYGLLDFSIFTNPGQL